MPEVYQNLAATSFLSPTGAYKPFDAAAGGYCRGEGAGIVVPRPLKDAIDNEDPILAGISGSAINQGSNKSPITVPDSDSQRMLYEKTFSQSGVAAEEVTRLIIPVEPTEWVSTKRVATVNNYGASGSNAALVVKDHPTFSMGPEGKSSENLSDIPILVSARSEESIRAYCGALCEFLSSDPLSDNIIRDLAYNLANKQNRALSFNLAICVSADSASSYYCLEAIASSTSADNIQKRLTNHFDNYALLRTHLTACEQEGQTLGRPSLFSTIFRPDQIPDIAHLHFVLFSIQYASAKAWLDTGLHVNRIVGHSFGQLTALSVADSLSIRDGIRLVSERAHLIPSSWDSEPRVMLAVEGTEVVVQRLLE
ncbi:CAZyme family CE10 [Penicillium atrosanguineum]|nr:CAZyme family CE10 [Penicillium atrosanguineum]